ncbi:MAG: hypothetical protein COS99_06370 [Candidatus Omnitrophica bacterium CG07_land_8_20_14_0_80_42_15]|uniref:Nucleotide-diphospho-sugar transferase domain-containing protein n=1 Tax=Candidatus Aquitaenariimonas noxiae TaxID=1974741 RepID=A0A2J0KS98_9BACT|nr:MAG: hypothetical protein COS99_06370 [Candidatus Omnitrophica bacterium CG07_land_8_20_14_0_80_42_15]
MNKNYGVVYVVLGEKAAGECARSIASVKQYCDYPVKVLSDHMFDVDAKVEIFTPIDYALPRWGVKNSDYFRLIALRESSWEVTAYLDNDNLIVSPRFLDGFEIAKHFGMAIPTGAWPFAETEIYKGYDSSEEDKKELANFPMSATAFDCAVIFYSARSKGLLDAWIDEAEKRPTRGPVVLLRAMWRTKQYPFCLTPNWRVEDPHVGIKDPIIVHLEHKHVKDYYLGRLPLFMWRIIWKIWDCCYALYLFSYKMLGYPIRFFKKIFLIKKDHK